LHLAAAQGLGALLAHDPGQRVHDVGLAGAVRADDGGDARFELQRGGRREELEAAQRQILQVHALAVLLGCPSAPCAAPRAVPGTAPAPPTRPAAPPGPSPAGTPARDTRSVIHRPSPPRGRAAPAAPLGASPAGTPAGDIVSVIHRPRAARGRDARAAPWIRVTTTMNHRMPQIRAHAADVLRFGWAERAPKFDRILTVPQTPGRGYTAPRPEHRASRSRTVRGGRSGMTRRPHRPEPRAAAISAAAPE